MSNHHDDSSEPPLLYAVPSEDWRHLDEAQPPHNIDAERAVLGSVMLSEAAFHDVAATIEPSDFYRPEHELIYDAATQLYATGQPVDAITVCDQLLKHGNLHRTGGAPYLHALIASVPTPASGGYYARMVADAAARRSLDHAATRIKRIAHASDVDTAELVQAAQNELAAATRTLNLTTTAKTTSWAPVDIGPILDGDITTPRATLMRRRDGKLLLYPAAVHSISGEPGCGKTWAALIAGAQEIEDGNPILYIDFEDRAESLVGRLLALGIPADSLRANLRYTRPGEPLNPTARADLEASLTDVNLVIVDGVTEAMTLHSLSLMDNEDVARWLALIPNAIANAGPAVVQIDHVVKNSETRGRYAIGGQHKLAGITGVAYKAIAVRSFGKGCKGISRLVVDKDKHGDVGPTGATVAELTLDATHPDGSVYGWLDTPGSDLGDDGVWRPTGIMHRVADFLAKSPGTTKNGIEGAVQGKREHVRSALQALILDGYVRTEQGPRGAVNHYLERPYEEPA